tara:strand:+ start:226 stop:756 length:531 start_codon:yes stop_codon:yes gene_type:complete
MACVLTQGFTLDCSDGFAGIKNFYISEYSNIDATATVIAAGVVTTLTQVGATNFYKYEVRQGNGSFVTTPTKSLENGTLFFDTVGQMSVLKLSASKNEEFKLLLANRAVVILEDFNGVYWIAGLENGAEFGIGGTTDAMSGVAAGDKYGYSLGFTDKATRYTPELDATVFAGLTIS